MAETKEIVLSDREETFINNLLEGQNLETAAENAGYSAGYGYLLKRRLAKHIVEAAENNLAMHAIKASRKVVSSIDAEMPNPIHLQAANSLLDRVGIIKKDNIPVATIKANIFILPEKQESRIDNQGITIENI
jgi:hypothetical protein